MKNTLIKKITKTITVLSLIAVVSTPAAAAIKSADPISSSNTVTTNKNEWVTSMQNTKVSSVQQTDVTLYRGSKGHNDSINKVKVGAKLNGVWKCVITNDSEGVSMVKNDVTTYFPLIKSVSSGTPMRIRLKLASVSANAGFSTDTVTNAWCWY